MAKRHAAPKHLPDAQKKQWNAKYDEALKNAVNNFPDDESAQHTAALKEANKMLAVPAPANAADIDKLASWQVITRETKLIDGKDHKTCATIDGRKYAFPVESK